MKHRLLKPYGKNFLSFTLNLLIEKPTRSTMYTVSLIDDILTYPIEKVSHYDIISNGIPDHYFIYCTRKIKTVKTGKQYHIYKIM